MQYVKETGISKNRYKDILTLASSDGKTKPTQEDLYSYLDTELEAEELTLEQAVAIWSAQGWETDFGEYKAKIEKKAITQAADTSGNGRLTQDELGVYLQTEIAAGRVSRERAEEIWSSQKWAKTFGEWSGTERTNHAVKVTDLESFKKYVPVYSDSVESAFWLFENEVKPLGISLEKYSKIIMDANTDGKGTATQDEMGMYLSSLIDSWQITADQAAAIWHTIWSKPNSNTFYKWRQSHYAR